METKKISADGRWWTVDSVDGTAALPSDFGLGKGLNGIISMTDSLKDSAIFKRHIVIEAPKEIPALDEYGNALADIHNFRNLCLKFSEQIRQLKILTPSETSEFVEWVNIFIDDNLKPEAEKLRPGYTEPVTPRGLTVKDKILFHATQIQKLSEGL